MIYTNLLDFQTTKIGACITETPDGDYIIFINTRCSREKQLADYLHELRHIARSDFEKATIEEAENAR